MLADLFHRTCTADPKVLDLVVLAERPARTVSTALLANLKFAS